MAINFPDNPVNGNTYTYENINYTFIRPDLAFNGYWAVVDPAALSFATSDDINKGTSNNVYNTPLALEGSKYVREDEVSGDTVLGHNGSERLRANSTGIDYQGILRRAGVTIPIVVEQDYNPFQGFRLWSDGTLECWGVGANVIGERTMTFAKEFNEIPSITMSCGNAAYVSYIVKNPAYFTARCYRNGSGAYTGAVDYIARGRAKL